MMSYMKTLSVVAFGVIDRWVKSFFPVFWFSNLSIMSVPYILNDNEAGGEETMYSLKGSFCLMEELLYGTTTNGVTY